MLSLQLFKFVAIWSYKLEVVESMVGGLKSSMLIWPIAAISEEETNFGD